MSEKVERRFGRIPSPPDPRDFHLTSFVPITLEPSPKERVWDYPAEKTLDQKNSTHCVGFSMANFGINLPTYTPYTNEDAHDFYYKCKIIDGNPGSEEGSTLRSASKVLRNVGAIDGYAFAYDLDTIKWWLLNRGPVIAGTIWTNEMNYPDEDGIIGIGGQPLGGHAYLLTEWTEDGYIGIRNSWGDDWGKKGMAYIKAEDFAEIFKNYGEAVTAVELQEYAQTQEPKWLRAIKEFIKKILIHFTT
jgi:hypothetical protein